MDQNSFYKICVNPSHKTLLGGSTGTGKSSVIYDVVGNFLNNNFRKDLDNSSLNELHSILNDQIPVVIFTEDNKYSLLLKLAKQLFSNNEISIDEKIKRIDNLCKIHNPNRELSDEELNEYSNFFQRHKTELLIIDSNIFVKNPQIIVNWSREYNLAIIQTLHTRNPGPGLANVKRMTNALSFNQLAASDFAAILSEPVKSANTLKVEVTVIKNRQGLNGEEFIYECKNSPY